MVPNMRPNCPIRSIYAICRMRRYYCNERSDNKVVSNKAPPLWENPWFSPEETYKREVVESKEEFKWVKRLFPKTIIPDVPKHDSYPTPSGWMPPKDPPLPLPYYVRRTRYNLFPIYSEMRRDELNLTTMEFSLVKLIILCKIDGDIFACEKDLVAFLEERLGRKIASHDKLNGEIEKQSAKQSCELLRVRNEYEEREQYLAVQLQKKSILVEALEKEISWLKKELMDHKLEKMEADQTKADLQVQLNDAVDVKKALRETVEKFDCRSKFLHDRCVNVEEKVKTLAFVVEQSADLYKKLENAFKLQQIDMRNLENEKNQLHNQLIMARGDLNNFQMKVDLNKVLNHFSETRNERKLYMNNDNAGDRYEELLKENQILNQLLMESQQLIQAQLNFKEKAENEMERLRRELNRISKDSTIFDDHQDGNLEGKNCKECQKCVVQIEQLQVKIASSIANEAESRNEAQQLRIRLEAAEHKLAKLNSVLSLNTLTDIIVIIMSYRQGGQPKVQKVMVQPINLVFRFLQSHCRVQFWLYENTHLRIDGYIVGFDEFMNIVLEEAEEVDLKSKQRRQIGRILLKGECITLIQALHT
ncbi:putative 39S ribosomal protein L49, mitochondrial [Trichinella pseudospiralis]|uniref:Large ribosomal subunit protein mL49 n=1 Tax=Trichinella pseudospiralis TaxID=6337 RepID=A0A0V1K1H7_TRIPS|nr:putative 39S ribosomal protein L49, mitochondrial [Trichinella pseudospiralis]KRZ41055.1 putative 39S ribosomal protein L49, mitochondrial [Trichinella pseudospiralis]KRZ41057.1 putative 39S ribosomal protein L49, mitochondrial [Trichinella pseudospiralis]